MDSELISEKFDVEINGIETQVQVDWIMQFGQPECIMIWDVENNDYIEHSEIDDMADLKHQLSDWAMNVQQVYQDHEINN